MRRSGPIWPSVRNRPSTARPSPGRSGSGNGRRSRSGYAPAPSPHNLGNPTQSWPLQPQHGPSRQAPPSADQPRPLRTQSLPPWHRTRPLVPGPTHCRLITPSHQQLWVCPLETDPRHELVTEGGVHCRGPLWPQGVGANPFGSHPLLTLSPPARMSLPTTGPATPWCVRAAHRCSAGASCMGPWTWSHSQERRSGP